MGNFMEQMTQFLQQEEKKMSKKEGEKFID